MHGLWALHDSQHADHHLWIDHAVPCTRSRQVYKGVLEDRSRAVFNGKVFVKPEAQKTDAVTMAQGNRYTFRIRPNNFMQVGMLVDQAKASGAKRWAIVAPNYEYGQSAAEVFKLKPDGVMLSNGPGDPEPCEYAIAAAREFMQRKLPLFGICLGHQILGLTYGGSTVKMPYGHRGGNHPVREVSSGRVLITSQNHGFAVEGTETEVTGAPDLMVTHVNLNDGSVEGLRHRDLPVFGVQYHPEAAPGPHDARPLFDDFVKAVQGRARKGPNS